MEQNQEKVEEVRQGSYNSKQDTIGAKRSPSRPSTIQMSYDFSSSQQKQFKNIDQANRDLIDIKTVNESNEFMNHNQNPSPSYQIFKPNQKQKNRFNLQVEVTSPDKNNQIQLEKKQNQNTSINRTDQQKVKKAIKQEIKYQEQSQKLSDSNQISIIGNKCKIKPFVKSFKVYPQQNSEEKEEQIQNDQSSIKNKSDVKSPIQSQNEEWDSDMNTQIIQLQTIEDNIIDSIIHKSDVNERQILQSPVQMNSRVPVEIQKSFHSGQRSNSDQLSGSKEEDKNMKNVFNENQIKNQNEQNQKKQNMQLNMKKLSWFEPQQIQMISPVLKKNKQKNYQNKNETKKNIEKNTPSQFYQSSNTNRYDKESKNRNNESIIYNSKIQTLQQKSNSQNKLAALVSDFDNRSQIEEQNYDNNKKNIFQSFAIISLKEQNQKVQEKLKNNSELQKLNSPTIKKKLFSGMDQIRNEIAVTEKSSEEDLDGCENELKEKASSKAESQEVLYDDKIRRFQEENGLDPYSELISQENKITTPVQQIFPLGKIQNQSQLVPQQNIFKQNVLQAKTYQLEYDPLSPQQNGCLHKNQIEMVAKNNAFAAQLILVNKQIKLLEEQDKKLQLITDNKDFQNDNNLFELKQKLKDLIYKKVLEKRSDSLKLNLQQNYLKFQPKMKKKSRMKNQIGKYSQTPQGVKVLHVNNYSSRQNSPVYDYDLSKNLVCQSVRSYENKQSIFKDLCEEIEKKFEKQKIENDEQIINNVLNQNKDVNKQQQISIQNNNLKKNIVVTQFDVQMKIDLIKTRQLSINRSTQQTKLEQLKLMKKKVILGQAQELNDIKGKNLKQNIDQLQRSQNQMNNIQINNQIQENGLSFLLGCEKIESQKYYSPRILKGQYSNRLYIIENNKYSQDLSSNIKNSQSMHQKQEQSEKTQIKETVNSSQMENLQLQRLDPSFKKNNLFINTNQKFFTPFFQKKSLSPQINSMSPKDQNNLNKDSMEYNLAQNSKRLQQIQTRQSQYKELHDQKSKFQNQDIQEIQDIQYDNQENKNTTNQISEQTDQIETNKQTEEKKKKLSRLEDQEVYDQKDLDQKFMQFGIIKNQETGQSFVMKNLNSEQCISMDQIQKSIVYKVNEQQVQIADLKHFKQVSEFYDEASQIHQMNSKLSPNISPNGHSKILNLSAFKAVSHDVSVKNTIEEIINSARDVKVVNQSKKKSIPLELFKLDQNQHFQMEEDEKQNRFNKFNQFFQINNNLNENTINSNQQSKIVLHDNQLQDKDCANTSRFQIILDINSGSHKLENVINSEQGNREKYSYALQNNYHSNQPTMQIMDSFSVENSFSEINRNIKTAATNIHKPNSPQLAWTNKNTPINCLRFFNLRKSKQANYMKGKNNDNLEIVSQKASRDNKYTDKNKMPSNFIIQNVVHSQFPILDRCIKNKKKQQQQQNVENLKKQVKRLKTSNIQKKEQILGKIDNAMATREEIRPFSQNNEMNMKIIEHNLTSDCKSLENPSDFNSFVNQVQFQTHQSKLKEPQFSKTWQSKDFKIYNHETIQKKMFLKHPQILIEQNISNNHESSLIDNKETTQNYSRNSSFSNMITPSSYVQNNQNRINSKDKVQNDTRESEYNFQIKNIRNPGQKFDANIQKQNNEALKSGDQAHFDSFNKIYYPNSKIIVKQSVLQNSSQNNDNAKRFHQIGIITPSVQRQSELQKQFNQDDHNGQKYENYKKVKVGSELSKQITDKSQKIFEQSQKIQINRQKYATPSEITSNVNKDQTLKTQSVKPSSNELMNSSQKEQAFSFVDSSSKQKERGCLKPNTRYGKITENSEIVQTMELEKNMIDYYITNNLTLQQQVDHQIKIKSNEAQNKILNQAITDYRNIMDGYGSNKSTVYLNTNRSIKKKENEKIIKIIEQDEKQKSDNNLQVKKQLSDEMHENDEEILSQISILQIQKFNELLENRKNIYSNDSLEPSEDKQIKKEDQNFSFKKHEINSTDRSDCERIKKALEKNYNNIQKELNIENLDGKNENRQRVSFQDSQQLNNENYLRMINNPNRLRAQFNLSIQLQRQIQQNIDNLSNSRRRDQVQQFHKGSSPGMIESIETLRNDLSQSINKINKTNEFINSPIISFQENISNLAQEESYHLSPLFRQSTNFNRSFILQMDKNALQNMSKLKDNINVNDTQRKKIETSNFLKKRNQKVVESLIFQQKSKNNELFPVYKYIENACFQEQNVNSGQNQKTVYNSVDKAFDASNRSSQIIQENYLQFKEAEQFNQSNLYSSVTTERKIQQDFLNKQIDLIQSQKHIEKLQNIPKQNLKLQGLGNMRIEDLKSIFNYPKNQLRNQIITPASKIQGRTTYQSYLNQQKAIQSSDEIKKLVKQKKLLSDIMNNYQIQKDFAMASFL